jgi:hypothetical protein
MFDDELAFHDRLTVCVGAAVPVPLNASAVLEVSALLVKVRVPAADPAAEGLNVTVKGTL